MPVLPYRFLQGHFIRQAPAGVALKRYHLAALVTVAGLLACDRVPPAAIGDYSGVTVQLSGDSLITVGGLPRDDVRLLRSASLDNTAWQRVIRVEVNGGTAAVDGLPAIAGRYLVRSDKLEFRPLFPFDAGREYTVHFDATLPPLSRASGRVSRTVAAGPRALPSQRTSVARVLPSAEVWPENQLRIYVEFSAPMSRSSGLDHVKLLDDAGREVKQAFLPVEADFWNHDATRYTLFLDPGRVKRGILPNEQMGAPLLKGASYTIVVDSLWRDAHGRPLAASYRKNFRATDAKHETIELVKWQIRAPLKGSREPLKVSFGKQLDHGLLLRALGVETARAVAVNGEGSVQDSETAWEFTPRDLWSAGEYQLVILAILEDGAGNRIDRAFEVDNFTHVDSIAGPQRYILRFTIR